MIELAERIRGHGLELPMVSVGSTPAATYTPTVSGITEMRPGTYVFNDNSAFRYGEFGVSDCTARFVATVVSRPAADRAVLDTGSKSLAMDPEQRPPRPRLYRRSPGGDHQQVERGTRRGDPAGRCSGLRRG